jgi:hypothetical protein
MTEKIKCPACYRKYRPTARNRCTGCGQQASWTIDPTEAFIADLNFPNVVEESGSKTEDRISELEYQLESLQSGVRSLACGVVLIVLSMGSGALMLTLGAAQSVSCAFSREASCGDGGLVTAGWVVLSLGTLIGLALAAGAMTRSSLHD